MAQSIDQQLHQYIDVLSASQKKSLLGMIKSFFQSPKPEENRRLTIEEYNKELDESIAEFETGNYYTMEQVLEMTKKWSGE